MLLVARNSGMGCGCGGSCGCGSAGMLAHAIRRLRGRRGMGDASASSGVLPIGTQLVYNCTFSNGLFQSPFISAASIVAAVAQNVQANSGISVVGTNASASPLSSVPGFTLTLQLNQAYTNYEMVQEVMDSAVNGSGYDVSVAASNVSVTAIPGQTPSSTGAPSTVGNTPVGNAPGAGTPAAGQPGANATSWLNQDGLGLGLNNGTYLAIGVAGVLGIFAVKQFV